MKKNDAELFLDWAADEFVAAGRAPEAEQRRVHRRQAELFCDIFRELDRHPGVRRPAKKAKESEPIGELLGRAFSSTGEGSSG